LFFLKDGKLVFPHPASSQNWWLIETAAFQLLRRTVEEADFTCLHTRNLNEDPLEKIPGALAITQL
jgi:hypothetical protein